jgi:hypothetical protein
MLKIHRMHTAHRTGSSNNSVYNGWKRSALLSQTEMIVAIPAHTLTPINDAIVCLQHGWQPQEDQPASFDQSFEIAQTDADIDVTSLPSILLAKSFDELSTTYNCLLSHSSSTSAGY